MINDSFQSCDNNDVNCAILIARVVLDGLNPTNKDKTNDCGGLN